MICNTGILILLIGSFADIREVYVESNKPLREVSLAHSSEHDSVPHDVHFNKVESQPEPNNIALQDNYDEAKTQVDAMNAALVEVKERLLQAQYQYEDLTHKIEKKKTEENAVISATLAETKGELAAVVNELAKHKNMLIRERTERKSLLASAQTKLDELNSEIEAKEAAMKQIEESHYQNLQKLKQQIQEAMNVQRTLAPVDLHDVVLFSDFRRLDEFYNRFRQLDRRSKMMKLYRLLFKSDLITTVVRQLVLTSFLWMDRFWQQLKSFPMHRLFEELFGLGLIGDLKFIVTSVFAIVTWRIWRRLKWIVIDQQAIHEDQQTLLKQFGIQASEIKRGVFVSNKYCETAIHELIKDRYDTKTFDVATAATTPAADGNKMSWDDIKHVHNQPPCMEGYQSDQEPYIPARLLFEAGRFALPFPDVYSSTENYQSPGSSSTIEMTGFSELFTAEPAELTRRIFVLIFIMFQHLHYNRVKLDDVQIITRDAAVALTEVDDHVLGFRKYLEITVGHIMAMNENMSPSQLSCLNKVADVLENLLNKLPPSDDVSTAINDVRRTINRLQLKPVDDR